MTFEPREEMKGKRIAFLFKGGRRARLNGSNSVPHEFFYGFLELREAGYPVEIVEESDLADGMSNAFWEEQATRLTVRLLGLNANSLAMFSRRASLEVLNQFDLILTTTCNQVLAMGVQRRMGRLGPRILAITMGILPHDAPARHCLLHRHLLKGVAFASLSREETGYLRDRLGSGFDVDYLPFGVDHRFWVPPVESGDGDYVLSVGNDLRRDYATLAAAWQPEYPPLKILTQLDVPASAGRIEVIGADWKHQMLSDAEVRELYQKARFVVIPVRQTIQPSGQSVCLQAMACGKAVILSDMLGMWDRDLMVNDDTCVLVPPGSVERLSGAIESLLADSARAAAIGARGRIAVERHFTIETMTTALRRQLDIQLA
jgi:glycosyltransferase involved in cell wall biosynthesis